MTVRRHTSLPMGLLKPKPSGDQKLPFRTLKPPPLIPISTAGSPSLLPSGARCPRESKPTDDNQPSWSFKLPPPSSSFELLTNGLFLVSPFISLIQRLMSYKEPKCGCQRNKQTQPVFVMLQFENWSLKPPATSLWRYQARNFVPVQSGSIPPGSLSTYSTQEHLNCFSLSLFSRSPQSSSKKFQRTDVLFFSF